MCWPLKLTAFERYMWCDSRPANPMTHFVVLRCSGPFDEAAFRTAVARAVDRHPLLRARIEGRENGPAHWVRAPAAPPDCNVAGADEPLRLTGTEELDLRRENGFRAWVRGAGGAVVIRLQFHHACCDGVAATRFIEDILVGYDHLVHRGTGDPPWPPLRPELLPHRADFGLSPLGKALRLPLDFWGVVIGYLLFILPRSTPAAAPHEPALGADELATLPEPVVHAFSTADTARLLAAARAAGATVNDVLLRDFFLALAAWNWEHVPVLQTQFVRIMVPFDLRTAADDALPAANVVGMVNVDRLMRRQRPRDRDALLRSVRMEMLYQKTLRFGIAANRIAAAIQAVLRIRPGLSDTLYGVQRCMTTAVVSNWGRLFDRSPLARDDGRLVAGGLVVDAVESVSPQRINSGLGFAISTYAGRLSLALNYDRRRFARADAEALLRTIVREVERSLAAPVTA
jgi:hypothetical protein